MTRASAYATSYRGDTGDWRTRAACRGDETNLWFPYSSESHRASAAKTVCADCPVRRDRLQWALEHHIKEGIWGGLDEEERATVRQRNYKRRQRVGRE